MKNRYVKMFVLGLNKFKDPYYQGVAAQIAFFMTLSIVPTFIVLTKLLGLLDISIDFITDWIDTYVAKSIAPMLKNVVLSGPATTTNVVMILMALWAASRAHFSIMRIANYTFTEGKNTGIFWRERIRSIITMVFTLFTVAFVIVILVYGKMILNLIFGGLLEGSIIDSLWTYLRWPVAGGLYFLMVSYSYYVLPREKLNYREVIPGSIFAAVGMLGVTVVYSIYVNYSINYDVIYGSLASFVALLFWFYFISWVLCLGIVVTKVWKDTK